MSEQIKKIVDIEMEANYWPKKGKDSKYYGPEATAKSLEKYTKAIVKECAKIAADTHPDDWAFISGKLLTHFGIEK